MVFGHAFGQSEAEQQAAEAKCISARAALLIMRLDQCEDGIHPEQLDECIGELRQLFDEEEILMIRSAYPDYARQNLSHRCFLCRMLRERETPGSGTAPGRMAADWLALHERQSGVFFRMYLQRRLNRPERSFEDFSPERIILRERPVRPLFF